MTRGAPAPPPPEMPSPLGDLDVLIVDDQTTMRKIVRSLLATSGIRRVREAANGHEALAALNDAEGQEIDLIIVDLHMPGMDGLTFCNHLRMSEALRARRIPVLVLTADRDHMVLDVVRQVGAADVIHKPISAPDLRAHIEQITGIKHH